MCSHHSYALMHMQVMNVEPYVLHTTYVYGHQAGKRTRLREAGLWLADQPSYFDGRFLTIDLDLPEVLACRVIGGTAASCLEWQRAGLRSN